MLFYLTNACTCHNLFYESIHHSCRRPINWNQFEWLPLKELSCWCAVTTQRNCSTEKRHFNYFHFQIEIEWTELYRDEWECVHMRERMDFMLMFDAWFNLYNSVLCKNTTHNNITLKPFIDVFKQNKYNYIKCNNGRKSLLKLYQRRNTQKMNKL